MNNKILNSIKNIQSFCIDVFDKRFLKTNLAMMVGCLLAAVALNITILHLKLVSPGITGIAVVIYYFSGIGNIAAIYFVINIPIYLIGWRYISPKFVLINILGTIYFTVALEITKNLSVPVSIQQDYLLTILCGVILAGLGTGIYLRYGGSIGGVDIIAIVIKKKIGLPLSVTFNSVNIINLVLNFIVQDLKISLMSAIYMFLMTFISIKTQTGFSQRLAVLIISNTYQPIVDLINQRLHRSSTLLNAYGSYSKQELKIVYTIINNVELGRLKEIVYDTDENALVTVLGATEVIGQKFISWEEQGYSGKKIIKN